MENDIRRDEPTDGIERLRHALMNRLTVVLGYAQMIAGRSDLDAATRSQAEQIVSQANECVRIMESWRRGTSRSEEPVPEQADPGFGAGSGGRGEPPVPGIGTRTSPGIRSGRVLVVDDEVIIRTLARHVLTTNYHVETCETAEEALRMIMVEDFDAVLIDLNLGGGPGGRGLYQTLRLQHPEVADRVIFMSGGVVGAEEVEFLDESGRPYIQKPFNIDKLRSLVEEMVSH